MKTLSIIIPAYNEEKNIRPLLEKVIAVPTEELGYGKEIIVVDDCSKDSTFSIASSVAGVKCIRHKVNQGKGRAVQNGVKESTGDYILVQDADLEYDPQDYIPMLKKLNEHPNDAVYGSRTLGISSDKANKDFLPGKHKKQGLGPWVAGVTLSCWTLALYKNLITDTLTAYKIYPSKVLKSFSIKTHGFETDHEITAKLIRSGVKIWEVPIRYQPRTVAEGKKIKWTDGVTAVWTLLRFRFSE